MFSIAMMMIVVVTVLTERWQSTQSTELLLQQLKLKFIGKLCLHYVKQHLHIQISFVFTNMLDCHLCLKMNLSISVLSFTFYLVYPIYADMQ